MTDQVMNARQAADWLGVHVNTIRTMAKDGRLPAFKTKEGTGHLRFLKSDLEDYQSEQDLSLLSPSILKDIHHYYAEKKLDRMKVEALVGGGYSAEMFTYLLDLVDPIRIFGTYLQLLEGEDYASSLQNKERLWITAGILTMPNNDKTTEIKKRLSVGTGVFSRGNYLKIDATMLLFQGDDKQIALDGTLQQFFPDSPKGIIMTDRNIAETFYPGFKEISLEKFAKQMSAVPEQVQIQFLKEVSPFNG